MNMKKRMAARDVLPVLAIVIVASGCTSVQRLPGPVQPDPAATARSESKELNVNLRLQEGADFRGVEEAIRLAVEGRLAEAGFVVAPDVPDIVVDLRAVVEDLGHAGNFFRFRGRVETSVTRDADRRLLGRKTAEADGDRQLGRDAALLALTESLAQKAADSVASAVVPARAHLAVEEIEVTRGLFARDDAAYKLLFTERVGALDGVIYCRLVAEDLRARSMTFRTLYIRERFPAGLLNRVRMISELGLPQR